MFERVSIDPNIAGGKPTVKGTRIPVTMILELVEDGLSFDDILQKYYPQLSKEDIQACIEYAKALVQGEEIHFFQETSR
ncbi:MAG: DUF433 domain-containing protein [Chloroflexi bacterium]|nr:DUF433 domain-containing protein [Chloroflexota bacterium]